MSRRVSRHTSRNLHWYLSRAIRVFYAELQSMVKGQCQICHDCFKLEKFLFLRCGKTIIMSFHPFPNPSQPGTIALPAGHGFCPECSKQTESQNTCAMCRSPKGRDGPRQIYITLAESNVEKATYLIQSLERIDINSRAKDLEKKPRKIQKILKSIKAEEEVAVSACCLVDITSNIHLVSFLPVANVVGSCKGHGRSNLPIICYAGG